MAVTIRRTKQTILEALKDWATTTNNRALMLVRTKTGECFQVVAYDHETGRATLVGPDNIKIKPILGQREVPLYHHVWR